MLQYWVRFTLQEAYLHQKQLVNTNYYLTFQIIQKVWNEFLTI